MPPSGPDQTDPAIPPEEDIRAQLSRILVSMDFPKAGRSAAMLTYVIEETLAGRAKRLKAYSIAVSIFNRPEKPTIDDPVVRIEAARLRRHLERYYLLTGKDDPIRIDIPKGGYVPSFTLADKPSEQVEDETTPTADARAASVLWPFAQRPLLTGWAIGVACVAIGIAIWARDFVQADPKISDGNIPDAPTLIVAPFTAIDNDPDAKLYATGLTEEMLDALPRFKELRVFGRETSAALGPEPDLKKVLMQLGARYLLTGGVRVDTNQIRVTARLMNTASGAIIWSEDYDGQLKTQGLFSIESRIANSVAISVAQPNGVIARADSSSLKPNDVDTYACTLHFYEYRAELSAEKHLAVRSCLESAVARYPQYATAWAMLSIIYLDEQRFKYNPTQDATTALERSLTAARRAMEIDPSNARAGQALMTSLFFNGYLDQSLQVGEQALEDNPNDTELLGEYGARLAMSGQWAKGASTLQKALKQNPGAGGFYNGVLALAKYMQADYQGAANQIQEANLQKFPLFHVVAAVIYAQNGMTEEASREGATFKSMDPTFLTNLTKELETRVGRPEDRARLVEGLRKAGLVANTSASVQQ
jgi:adenylate cyclase